jgi:hypothetical protein
MYVPYDSVRLCARIFFLSATAALAATALTAFLAGVLAIWMGGGDSV